MLRSSFYLLPSPKAQEVGQAIVKCIQPVGATLRLIWALLDKVRRQVLLRANGEVARYWWPAHWTSLQLGCEHTQRITSSNGWGGTERVVKVVLTKADGTNAGMSAGQQRSGEGKVVTDDAELLDLRWSCVRAQDGSSVASARHWLGEGQRTGRLGRRRWLVRANGIAPGGKIKLLRNRSRGRWTKDRVWMEEECYKTWSLRCRRNLGGTLIWTTCR